MPTPACWVDLGKHGSLTQWPHTLSCLPWPDSWRRRPVHGGPCTLPSLAKEACSVHSCPGCGMGAPAPASLDRSVGLVSLNQPSRTQTMVRPGMAVYHPHCPQPEAPHSPLADQPCGGRLISSCPSTPLSALLTHKVGGGVGGLPSLAQLSFLDNPPPPPPALTCGRASHYSKLLGSALG